MSRKIYHFTPEMLEELRQLYPTNKSQDLAIKFNCTVRKIYNLAWEMKLKKDMEWIRENARQNMNRPNHPAHKFWIKKGTIPVNKGKKQTDYMTPEAIERTKRTQFKTGQRGWNHKEVGYERINVDGYTEIKVAEPNVFKLKQRVVWVEHFGEIPLGYNIQFRDGNPQNLEPENLYMISRANQLKNENSMYARYPIELQLAIKTKAALQRIINNQIKIENNNQLKLQQNEH